MLRDTRQIVLKHQTQLLDLMIFTDNSLSRASVTDTLLHSLNSNEPKWRTRPTLVPIFSPLFWHFNKFRDFTFCCWCPKWIWYSSAAVTTWRFSAITPILTAVVEIIWNAPLGATIYDLFLHANESNLEEGLIECVNRERRLVLFT